MVHAVTKINLGDDLFLDILFKRYPNTTFVLYVRKKYHPFYKKYPNTKVYSSTNIINRGLNYFMRKLGKHAFVQRKIAINCDVSIHIGGSIYQQKANWVDILHNRKALLIKNQPFFVLGANFGAFTDETFYDEYLRLFRKYEDICFRDDYSYNLYQKLPNVRKAADIVFSLKYDFNIKVKNKVVISIIKPSFRPYLKKYDFNYYQKIKEIAINYVKEGYEVVLMSFCKAEGDEMAINEVLDIIPEEYIHKIKTHKYYGDIDKALKEIASSSAIIATRFHAMILGWVFKKPTLPIAYNEKMTNVMKDVNYTGKFFDFDNLNDLTKEHYQIEFIPRIDNITKQIFDSEKHFNKLDRLLL